MKKLFIVILILCTLFCVIKAKNEYKKYDAIYWFEYLGTSNLLIDTFYVSFTQTDLINNVIESSSYIALLKGGREPKAIRFTQDTRGDFILLELLPPRYIDNYEIKLYSIKFVVIPYVLGDTIILSGIVTRMAGSLNFLTVEDIQDTAIPFFELGQWRNNVIELIFNSESSGYPSDLYFQKGKRYYTLIGNFIVGDSVYIENVEIVYRYTRKF